MEKKTILIVEDNPDAVELTMRAFRKCNLNADIIVARDGVEALDYIFAERSVSPELILLDIKLPRIGGIDVLKKIRSADRTRLYPVVIFSGSKLEVDLTESYRSGANSYIRKPVDFGKYVDAVFEICSYWLNLNEPPPKAA